jgi:hypothetical protein
MQPTHSLYIQALRSIRPNADAKKELPMEVATGGRISIVPKPDRRRQPQGPSTPLRREPGARLGTGEDEHPPAAFAESRAEIIGTWVVGAASVGVIVLVALLSLG